MTNAGWRGMPAAGAFIGLMLLASPGESGEGPASRHDQIARVEQVLTHAAQCSPRWHSHQALIQRDVHDISYLVERAMKTPDPILRREYAAEALALLKRALSRGFFHTDEVRHVVNELHQLIPDRAL